MKRTESIAFRTVLMITVPLLVMLAGIGIFTDWQVGIFYDGFMQKDISQVHARGEQMGAVLQEMTDFTVSIRSIKRMREGTPADRLEAMKNIKQWKPKAIGDLMYIYPDGNFLNATGETGSVATRDYFKEISASDKEFIISQPIVSKVDGQAAFVVIVKLFTDGGELSGYASCMIPLESLSGICKTITFGKTGYSWMVDGAGLVLAHPDPKQVFSLNLTTADAEKRFSGMTALNKRIQDNPFDAEGGYGQYKKPDGSRYLTFYTKIPNSPDWSMGLSISEDEYFNLRQKMIVILMVLFAICVAIVVGVSLLVARSILAPLKQAQMAFERLASGDADLSAKIDFKEKNEIGALVQAFNNFLDKLRNIVINLKDEQQRLDTISAELKQNTGSTEQTAIAMSKTIQAVMDETGKQNNLTADSSAGVNEIAANIESLDNLITSQSSSITEASSAIEQMVHNISSISNSMNKMSAEYTEVTKESATGKDLVTAMNEHIVNIVKQSESLLEVNQTISKIAAQTNLLAMNAAIESAHAGESGKGFAVVADEIRRLAEDSSTQSKIINKELTEIQASITEVAVTAKDSEQSFSIMSARLASTENLLREIHRALQEQSEGSKQILLALKEMNEISSEVKSGASEMRMGNESILSAMNSLKTVTEEIGGMMGKLTENSAEIAAKAENLSDMADGTSNAVAEMENAIGKFTV